MKLPAKIRLLRPGQWTKNGIVLAALFFAYWDPSQASHISGHCAIFRAFSAAFLFCLVSSGVYALNDWRDCEEDKLHPVKKRRPVASGEVSRGFAFKAAAALLAGGCALSFAFSIPAFAMAVCGYAVLQLAYTFALKRVPVIDVVAISAGFVIRAVAGALVLSVRISPWLLSCTFTLALFLALCKRRQEKISGGARKSLAGYSGRLLNTLIVASAIATVGVYSAYAISPDTIQRFGTSSLAYTIPIVALGISRYAYMAYRKSEGERPEVALFSDPWLVVSILSYLACVCAIFLK